MPEFVRVGQVTAPFGVQGAVKVYPLTDFEDRFAPGSELFLDGEARRVEWWKPGHPTVTLKLTGIDNRTLAELHRGRYLEVPSDAVKPLSPGSYYHHQLVGLAVVTDGGRKVGAMRISATAAEAGAPGSPVRVRARHATVNPSTTLPHSASPVAAHGSASPRCAPARISTAPAATGASSARARIPVRRAGPVNELGYNRLISPLESHPLDRDTLRCHRDRGRA